MPVYEYRCHRCNKKATVFFRGFSDNKTPTCNHCGSDRLTRLISKVTVIKSWGDSLSFPGSEFLDSADENDPAQMERWMKDMKRGLGDPDPTLSALDKMDAGIDPHADDASGLDLGDD